jgi:hypothetical protein
MPNEQSELAQTLPWRENGHEYEHNNTVLLPTYNISLKSKTLIIRIFHFIKKTAVFGL